MSAVRSAHDPQPELLWGYSLEEARAEAARLAAKALEITRHLNRVHYIEHSVVRRNLLTERDGYEWEASGWLARIAEAEARQTVQVGS